MRPRPYKRNTAAFGIVFRVNIEKRVSRHTTSGRISADGPRVVNPNPGSVVGLISQSIDDVEIVIDGFMVCGEECASRSRVAEVGEVDDVGDWTSRSSRATGIALVELVVEQDVLVPVALCPPALMAVRCAWVGEGRQDFRGVGHAVFGGRVVDGDSVFVVADADVAAAEAAVGAVVCNALSVVDVAVLACTARGRWGTGVRDVDVLQTAAADSGARLRADLKDGPGVPVDDDVVSSTEGHAYEVSEDGGVVVAIECDWIGRINVEQLVEVENLDAVADGFATNDCQIVEDANFSPTLTAVFNWVGGREAADICELALARDLHEGSAGELRTVRV